MAADVEPVSLVVDRPRDAAHVRAALENERSEPGLARLEGGGQAGRSAADDRDVEIDQVAPSFSKWSADEII